MSLVALGSLVGMGINSDSTPPESICVAIKAPHSRSPSLRSEGVRERVCAGESVRERVCARDCMYGYTSCRRNGEVVREGVCKSVCVHWDG